MSSKSLLILAIVGFCFISVESFHFDLNFSEIGNKFNKLKDHAENLFKDVEDKWYIISNDVKVGVKTVDESFHDVKNRTLNLVTDAEVLYRKIKVESVQNYENFGKVYRDLQQSVNDLKEHGGESLRKFKALLGELKQDVVDVKEFFKTGNAMALKKDFENVKVKYTSFKMSFEKSLDKIVADVKKTEVDTKVLIDGVEKECVDVVEEAERLFEEAQNIFHDIVFNGKKSYAQFKKVFEDLRNLVNALKKIMPEKVYNQIEASLSAFGNFIEKHETVTKVSGELVSAGEEVAAEAELEEALGLIILL